MEAKIGQYRENGNRRLAVTGKSREAGINQFLVTSAGYPEIEDAFSTPKLKTPKSFGYPG